MSGPTPTAPVLGSRGARRRAGLGGVGGLTGATISAEDLTALSHTLAAAPGITIADA